MEKEPVAIESPDVESKPPAPWKGRRAGSGGGRTAQIIGRSRNAIVKIARDPVTAWRMLWPRYGPFAPKAPDVEFRRVIRWSFGNLKREPLNAVFPGIEHTDVHVVRSYDREPLLSMTPAEVLAVGAMVSFLRPKRILEIGTFEGNTTVNQPPTPPQPPMCSLWTCLLTGVVVTRWMFRISITTPPPEAIQVDSSSIPIMRTGSPSCGETQPSSNGRTTAHSTSS